ncbi:helix-turn-helix domain-containing protein [Pseudomonas sp. LF242]
MLHSELCLSKLSKNVSIGARLKSERLRLGISQAEIGRIGGVEVNAQGRYENNIRFPRADYLAAVAKAGVDVLFVITGQRTQNGSADSLKAAAALDSATECLEKAKELIR